MLMPRNEFTIALMMRLHLLLKQFGTLLHVYLLDQHLLCGEQLETRESKFGLALALIPRLQHR